MSDMKGTGKYDVRVTGLGTPIFYAIHITSLSCISVSFASALFVIISSFYRKSFKTFFKTWAKCERFCVYIAVCDGLFNLSHFMDHFHMTVTRYHVVPIELCEFYAFFVFEFISAQYVMVVLIALNAVFHIKYKKEVFLGQRDYKFLLLSFGGPFVICCIALALDKMGPVGSLCGISDRKTNLFFSIIPVLGVIITCTVLYTITWFYIFRETQKISSTLGSQSCKATRRAARNMTLFVLVFFVQYAPSAISSVVMMFQNISPLAVPIVLGFTNMGGFLNCIVYLIVRKKKVMTNTEGKYRNTAMTTLSTGTRKTAQQNVTKLFHVGDPKSKENTLITS